MLTFHRMKVLTIKVIKKLLFQNPNSLYRKAELKNLQDRMDRGDFAFTPEEERKMIKQWHFCVSECPLPTKIRDIYYKESNAFAMNSLEVAEAGFKLPYGYAFEEAQVNDYQAFVDFALENQIEFQKKNILDAGCGFGGLLAAVHKNFPTAKCVGFECVESAKQLLSKIRPWIQVYIGNIESSHSEFTKFFPLQADVIFCTAVLEHLHRPMQAIKNLLSLKSKGGVLILSVPNGRKDHASHHIHFWSPESWSLFIQEAANGYRIDFPKHKTINSKSPVGYDLYAIIRDF